MVLGQPDGIEADLLGRDCIGKLIGVDVFEGPATTSDPLASDHPTTQSPIVPSDSDATPIDACRAQGAGGGAGS